MHASLTAVQQRAQIAHPSFFVGLLLRGAALPYSNYGHVVLAQPSPILFYPISSTEVRRMRLFGLLQALAIGGNRALLALRCAALRLCALRAPESEVPALGPLVDPHSTAAHGRLWHACLQQLPMRDAWHGYGGVPEESHENPLPSHLLMSDERDVEAVHGAQGCKRSCLL